MQLPIVLNSDEEGGTEETLKRNNASYHQSCELMFHNSKLEWEKKRTADIQNDPEERHSKMHRSCLGMQQCFFLFFCVCEKMESVSELRQAMALQLD